MSNKDDSHRKSNLLSRAAALLPVLAFRPWARRERDKDVPLAVAMNRRTARLEGLAFELVESGRDDDDGVRTLRELAGHRRDDLLDAAASVRQSGLTDEVREINRANAMLLAASSGDPLRSLTPEDERWFATVDQLALTAVDVAFAQLAKLEPALVDLETSVRRSPKGWSITTIHKEVSKLAGAKAQSPRRLIRTTTAASIACTYLDSVAGLLDE